MCDFSEEDSGNPDCACTSSTADSTISTICNKCKTMESVITMQNREKYCRDCFLSVVVHSFRATLGKTKLIQNDCNTLVCLNVGQSTTTLIDLIQTGLALSTTKRLRMTPTFLFIEDLFEESIETRRNVLKSIEKAIRKVGQIPRLVSLRELIETTNSDLREIIKTDSDGMEISGDDEIRILDCLRIDRKILKTLKLDYLNVLRRQKIIQIADFFKCKVVLLPDTAEDVTSDVLMDFSMGRGPIGLPIGDHIFLKPLKDFSTRELSVYNSYRQTVDGVSIVKRLRENDDSDYDSIQELVRNFVCNLQDQYPATMRTVVRTGEKITYECGDICELCQGPKAVNKSQPNCGEIVLLTEEKLLEKFNGNEPKSSNDPDLDSLDHKQYCYTCQNMLKYFYQ